MPVHLTILGSGSGGNCAYLETGRDPHPHRRRVQPAPDPPAAGNHRPRAGKPHGILVTHEHSDHVQGLAGCAGKLGIPIYCNRPTQEAIEYQLKTQFDCRLFETGASFEIGDMPVETFTIPHDAQDPVGFLLRTPPATSASSPTSATPRSWCWSASARQTCWCSKPTTT